MAAVARRHRLAPLVAPVRPSWKDRYPLIPIERYASWRRQDVQRSRLGAKDRYDAERTVAVFAAGLKDAVDLDTVREDLVGAVQAALEPAHVAVWITPRD